MYTVYIHYLLFLKFLPQLDGGSCNGYMIYKAHNMLNTVYRSGYLRIKFCPQILV